ncbi:MAG: hypothetical protein FWG96_06720 [Methanomassiliicoccaceae archaeon]|nr:hypothetical protein [Methanomassiliicoccaceae archaeon]
MAGDIFICLEDKEELEGFSEEDLPEMLRDVLCDLLISMMDEIERQNATHCDPEKCEEDCDLCEIRAIPKIICIRSKVIRTNGRA